MVDSIDALAKAIDHLAAVSGPLRTLHRRGRILPWRSGSKLMSAMATELAMAIELVRGEVERQRARVDLHEGATARLELVTAGDERLIDDLGAAIEELQRDVDRLTLRQDLLVERDSG